MILSSISSLKDLLIFPHGADITVYSSKSCTKWWNTWVTNACISTSYHTVPVGVMGVQMYRPTRHREIMLALSLYGSWGHLSFVDKQRWQKGDRCSIGFWMSIGCQVTIRNRRWQSKAENRNQSHLARPSQRWAEWREALSPTELANAEEPCADTQHTILTAPWHGWPSIGWALVLTYLNSTY